MSEIEQAAVEAKAASRIVATLPTDVKNAVLAELAAEIESRKADILAANAADMAAAREAGLPDAKLRRLELTERGIAQLCDGLRQVASLPDPVNRATRSYEVPSGLKVRKVRTPIGVIAMIYEARPGVTIDAFALCFKAGNACLLKGGKEANASNALLAEIARDVLARRRVPEGAMSAITTSDREELRHLLTLDQHIDLVIPRGGAPLIRFVHEHSRIPTVQHFHGVCHCYVDEHADLEKALEIAITAKTSAPATCNALECVLVHEKIAGRFVPAFVDRCLEAGVEIRADQRFREVTLSLPPEARGGLKPAEPDDFGTEFLDLIVATRVVTSVEEAIDHIARFGSNHTECVVTEDRTVATRFVTAVQSSCVLVNASTRFNDGYQLGLGAEIGISTSKIHAYGPMGLEELTTERYVVEGSGQVR